MNNSSFDRKFWLVSWPLLLVAISILGAIINLSTDLGFWGSVLPPLIIVALYLLAATAYLRRRHKTQD